MVLLAPQAVLMATDLTGTFHKPDGTPVNGKLIFLLSQPARLSDNSAQVVPMVKIFTVTNGQLQTGAFIYGNDVLVPTGTYYLVRLVDDNNNLLFEQKWSIQGATLDLGTMTPTTTGVVLPDPLVKNVTTDQAVQGPVTFSGGITATSLNLSGNLGPSADAVFDLGSSNSRWRELHAQQWAGRIHPGVAGGTVTPSAAAPSCAQESSTGGSIADGTYYFVTTLVNLNGETTVSPQQTLVISAGTGTAKIKCTVTGREWATGAPWYKLWGGTVNGGPYWLQTPQSLVDTMDNNTVRRRPSSVSVSSISRTSNVVSVTTSAAHGMAKGETFQVTGVSDSTYNGTVAVFSAPTTTTLTYYKAGTDGSSSGGTVTPSLAGFVTLSKSGDTSLGVTDGDEITVAGATGCSENPNGTFRVYSHKAGQDPVPTGSSVTFKHGTTNESGCGGASITVSRPTGMTSFGTGAATQLVNAHLVRGEIIITSVATSGTNPPSTNTAAIDDVQVAINSARVASTLAAGQIPRVNRAVHLSEGNDLLSGFTFYLLTTPVVLSNGDRLIGQATAQLSASVNSGTLLDARTGSGGNPLWDDVYDKIGTVMIINSTGTEMKNINIQTVTNGVFIFHSNNDSESSSHISLGNGTWITTGSDVNGNCPAPLRIQARMYYFRLDNVELVANSTRDCFASDGRPRGAALMFSNVAGSEWYITGPRRWTIPAKHDMIQNRKGPTDPDRGAQVAGFSSRADLDMANMGHFQGTAGGGTGVICRCENTQVTMVNVAGSADYTVSAGSDAAYIFGQDADGAVPTITAFASPIGGVANNAASIQFTNAGPTLQVTNSSISAGSPSMIDFQGFSIPAMFLAAVDTGGLGLCDPRNGNHFANRVTAPGSGSNAISCFGAPGSNTADRREYGQHFQGGLVRQGFRANAAEARIWESWTENGTGLNFYRIDPDTQSQRFMQWDTSAINFYGADGSAVIQRINKATGQAEFPNTTGTPPFTVTSTTEVANLNPQLWRGKQALDFSSALDFGSISAQSCSELTVSVTGAVVDSPIVASWPAALEANLVGSMRVSAASTVTVRLCNVTGAAIDPASRTFAGRVIQ